mmetsp:Transcript_32681/g.55460  ORF Transcript_32681/g.55460 Transcript_32681/m.55460 type:complete len:121 (-) Transcript_32681:1072-1434(-)
MQASFNSFSDGEEIVPSSRLLYGSKSVWNRKRKAAANRRRILLRESKKVSMASLKAGGTAEEEEEGDDDNLEVIGFCNCEEYNLAGLQMYLKAKVLLLESCCKQGCVVGCVVATISYQTH